MRNIQEGKVTFQTLDLLKLMIFFLNTGTPKNSKIRLFFALFTYHGGSLKISFEFIYLPFTVLFHVRKTTFLAAEMRALWAEESKGVTPSLCCSHPYCVSIHFAQLLSVSAQQCVVSAWENLWESCYEYIIFVIMSNLAQSSVLKKTKDVERTTYKMLMITGFSGTVYDLSFFYFYVFSKWAIISSLLFIIKKIIKFQICIFIVSLCAYWDM